MPDPRRRTLVPLLAAPMAALSFAGANVRAEPAVSAVTGAAPVPACKDQLSLGFDAENGAFDGMSQSGVLLVLRNLGPKTCRTGGLPALTMLDASGRPLGFVRQPPAGMHPGPVVVPVAIAPGAEATAELSWVSGDAYGAVNCRTPAEITVAAGQLSTAAWPGGAVCGPGGRPISYRQGVLRLDPRP